MGERSGALRESLAFFPAFFVVKKLSHKHGKSITFKAIFFLWPPHRAASLAPISVAFSYLKYPRTGANVEESGAGKRMRRKKAAKKEEKLPPPPLLGRLSFSPHPGPGSDPDPDSSSASSTDTGPSGTPLPSASHTIRVLFVNFFVIL